ncbi:MAG: GNAT family N-acetyltransferase [Candidatus Competibacteraceae bacterium]
MALVIVPLGKQHDRKSFDCGEPALNHYLHQYANQDIKRRVNRVFVALPPDEPQQVIGYYSLSTGSLVATDLPEGFPAPSAQVPGPGSPTGAVGCCRIPPGQGLGTILLADALQRIVQASQSMAVYALAVDALNDRAAKFYEQFGFIHLPSQFLKLFLPMDSIPALADELYTP